jgi:hypothetical protein
MQANLTFCLPEEEQAFNYARNGAKYKQVIDEVFYRLRRLEKIDCPPLSIQDVRDMLNEARKEAGVFNED